MNGRVAVTAAVVAGLALSACGGSTAPPGTQSVLPQTTRRITMGAWRDSLARTTLPQAGCYETSFPSTRWTLVSCSQVTGELFPPDPARVLRPHQVGGGGGQVEAYINAPALIGEAIGSFPLVTGVTSEYSVPSKGGASFGASTFSLQMNSEFFQTAACGANTYCVGWEQFVFGNHPPGGSIPSHIFIQDWLLARSASALTCPRGWAQAKSSCVRNSKGIVVPFVPVKNLGALTMWGYAAPGGDSVFLAIGKKSYAVRKAQPDGITDLSQHWGSVQFNILGDGGGSVAVFNPGSSVTVQLQVATGQTLVTPLCVLAGSTTAESNTLSLSNIIPTPEPAQFPSIVFAESNSPTRGNAQCRAVGAATP